MWVVLTYVNKRVSFHLKRLEDLQCVPVGTRVCRARGAAGSHHWSSGPSTRNSAGQPGGHRPRELFMLRVTISDLGCELTRASRT